MEQNNIFMVEIGGRTMIGRKIDSTVFSKEDGYITLTDLRMIQGQIIPMATANNIKGLDGKPMNQEMGYAFMLFPYPSNTMIFYEDNIIAFIPLTSESPIYNMYMKEIENKKWDN